jgi:GTPase SAR1 family protein
MATPTSRDKKEFIGGAMDKWWDESNSVNILISGKTGTGKSSLVNSLLGKEVAKVGETLDPETSEVISYTAVIRGIKVAVWDSPGLQDGLEREDEYLADIRRKCKDDIDLFIYCVSMENTRFEDGNRDIDSMCKLTDTLGKNIWNNAVFILTCANMYITSVRSTLPSTDGRNATVKEKFDERFEEWKVMIKQCLHKKLSLTSEVINRVPIVPAGKKVVPLLLKGYPNSAWLSKLWLESLLATKHKAQPALIKMNIERLKYEADIQNAEEFQDLLEKERIIIYKRAQDIGKLFQMEDVGREVGEKSGIKASIAHIMDHKYHADPHFTLISTTVVVDEHSIEVHLNGMFHHY